MTTTHHPAGVITLLHTVRVATHGIKGIHVEAYARGVLITTRPNDAQGASRISRAHAALRIVGVRRVTRQAPNVLKIVAPRRRANRVTRD